MKTSCCLFVGFILLVLTASSWGAGGRLDAVPASFDRESLEIGSRSVAGEQFDIITVPGLELTRTVGHPSLPVKTVNFYIPRGKAVESILIESVETTRLPGRYAIMPAQPELPLEPGFDREYIPPDEAVYSSHEPYPAAAVSYVGTGCIAGRKIAAVKIFPLQFVPADGEVILNTRVAFSVQLTDADGETPIPPETESVRDLRSSIVSGLVSNGADVEADLAGGGGTLDPSDAVEYLIIAHQNHADEYEPLREWKRRKGVPAEIVTLDDLLATYSGRDDAEKVRNCIIDYYSNHGTAWVLLTLSAPKAKIRGCYCSVGGTVDDGIPCDLYFSDLDGDWNADGDDLWGEVSDNVDLYPDVYVGRIPTNLGVPSAIAVDKILTYEGFYSIPTDYQLEMLFLAEYADAQTDGAVGKNLLANESVPARFNPINKLYESSGNLNKTSAMNALNSGQGLINHDGHGNNTLISIGPSVLNTNDAMALTNGPRYSVLYTVACDPANFGSVMGCFGRSFVESPEGGGFFVGNSRYGWYWPGNPGYGAGELFDREFFKSMFVRGHEHLGVIHADAKAQRVPYSMSNGTNRWTQFTSNLLGDPETPVWLDTPLSLAASHAESIDAALQSFGVYVTNAGSPLSGARVCLWKTGDLYEVQVTAGEGLATFTISPSDSGEMMVTVTKNGYLPYVGSSYVRNADAGVDAGIVRPMSLRVLPNPARGSVKMIYALPGSGSGVNRGSAIEIYDARGRLVDSIPVEKTTSSYKSVAWDGRSQKGARLPSGIYFLKISDGNDTISTKFVFLR
jgi:hypothetical protein